MMVCVQRITFRVFATKTFLVSVLKRFNTLWLMNKLLFISTVFILKWSNYRYDEYRHYVIMVKYQDGYLRAYLWGLFFLHTGDGLSCVRQTKTKHTNGFHNAMIHTNSATGSTILSTLLTKSDYRGTIGIALTINTSLGLEKIGLQCLAISYHIKPAP